MPDQQEKVAFFVSPHGFGHAARAAAVIAALRDRRPGLGIELFSSVPKHFFDESVSGGFGYHEALTDVGLVQRNALVEDLTATLRVLADFLPFSGTVVDAFAEHVSDLGCRLVVCDIAPIGIEVARRAGVPSVLVENFTWEWIYEGYLPGHPEIRQHVDYLHRVFAAADYHIQARPVCRRLGHADLVAPPISREFRSSRSEIRHRLGVGEAEHMVLITMGGIAEQYGFVDRLRDCAGVTFVAPGNHDETEVMDNVILLPHHSAFYHPDLVNTANAVVGKVGYSTLAEVYHAGVPFGYVSRPTFRESAPLAAFIAETMPGLPITPEAFRDGQWVEDVPALLAMPRNARARPNGADAIADFLCDLL